VIRESCDPARQQERSLPAAHWNAPREAITAWLAAPQRRRFPYRKRPEQSQTGSACSQLTQYLQAFFVTLVHIRFSAMLKMQFKYCEEDHMRPDNAGA
jgi:hypothetical protein